MPARNYSNVAQPTSLTAAVDNVATTLPVASTTGYPNPPFVIALERGDANEEVVLVQGKTSNAFTNCVRGYDSTASVAHLAGRPIEHTTAAIDYRDFNDHIYNTALDAHTQYLNVARHNQVDHTQVFTSGGSVAPPVGSVIAFAGLNTPDALKFLLCYGQAVSRVTYATAFTQIGTIFGAGDNLTTFNMPDLRGRVVVGLDTMGGAAANVLSSANALGYRAGNSVHVLTVNEMPVHNHTGVTGAGSAHTHTGSSTSAGSHTHTLTSANPGVTLNSSGYHSHTTVSNGGHAHSGTTNSGGAHAHGFRAGADNVGNTYAGALVSSNSNNNMFGGYIEWSGAHYHDLNMVLAGDHSHTVNGEGTHTHTGSVDSHSHTANTTGDHSHTMSINTESAHTHSVAAQGSGASHNNVQPYIALSYLMRVA